MYVVWEIVTLTTFLTSYVTLRLLAIEHVYKLVGIFTQSFSDLCVHRREKCSGVNHRKFIRIQTKLLSVCYSSIFHAIDTIR